MHSICGALRHAIQPSKKKLLELKTKHQLLEEAYRHIKVAKLKAICEDPLGDVAYVQALIGLLELALSEVHS